MIATAKMPNAIDIVKIIDTRSESIPLNNKLNFLGDVFFELEVGVVFCRQIHAVTATTSKSSAMYAGEPVRAPIATIITAVMTVALLLSVTAATKKTGTAWRRAIKRYMKVARKPRRHEDIVGDRKSAATNC